MYKPLYVMAEEGTLKDEQKLDIPTLDWIKKNSNLSIKDIKKIKKDFCPLNVDTFKKYLPEKKWFSRKGSIDGIHGLGHIYRVMLYSYSICEILNIEDFRIPLIAAAIHDVKRISDKDDLSHGSRAAEWCGDQVMEKYDISRKDLCKIRSAVGAHNTPYDKISLNEEDNIEILILKHADALDRFRLPKKKWWPKEEYIKLKLTPQIFHLANYIVCRTEELVLKKGYSAKEAVILTGLETNVLTK